MAYFQKVPAKNKQGYRWKCTKDAPFHPVTGKRRQVTRRGETKKAAEKKVDEAIEIINKEDRGDLNINLKEITVNELFKKWLELVMKRRLKESTFREYSNTSKKRILPVIGEYRVDKLNTVTLQKFINDLVDEGLSPRYIEYINTILYGALESARVWRIISFNPLIDVEKPRPRRKKYTTWTVEDMNRFLSVAKATDLNMYTLVSLAIKTGIRRGEILALMWKDIDFDNTALSIERNLMYGEDGYKFSTPKTEASLRKIVFGESLLKDLKQWKAKQNEIKIAIRHSYKDNDLVFANKVGNTIYPRDLGFRFNELIEMASVPKIRFHDLRHTHATLSLEAGMSLKEVQERLGHSSIKTTGDVYAHVTENMKKKSSDLFEKHISKQ